MYGRFQKARLQVEAQRLGHAPPVPAARPVPVSPRDHELAVAGYQRRIAELEAALTSGGPPPGDVPSMADLEAAVARIGELEALLAEERAKNAKSGSHGESDSNVESDAEAKPADSDATGGDASGDPNDAAGASGGDAPAASDAQPSGKTKGARKGK